MTEKCLFIALSFYRNIARQNRSSDEGLIVNEKASVYNPVNEYLGDFHVRNRLSKWVTNFSNIFFDESADLFCVEIESRIVSVQFFNVIWRLLAILFFVFVLSKPIN